VLRTAAEPARLAGAIKREFLSLDSRVALIEPTSLEALLDRALFARPRFSLLVLGIFACAGVVLVALGVYGVLAYTVSQQTREIAIRLALGGDRGHIVRMVLSLGMQMVAVGLVIGVAVSFATNRLLQSELWGTTPTDPATFAGAILVTLAVGAIACLVPARRAVRVEPMVALRQE
jgi:ABC-type antimicrobial peptide transport system permease subunit